ncbi:MAG: hypothetical protein KC877_02840 [Candidatus Kaiserbacteria bacterium]|nr:hypothetical protein [Candidatus Kaiserbacteria bacterium]MCB9816747.1 hypothetical protein [Candidatus Nomurabacteria bacterium]
MFPHKIFFDGVEAEKSDSRALALRTLFASSFPFHDVECYSIRSLLYALRYCGRDRQLEICQLRPKLARKEIENTNQNYLYWDNQLFPVDSDRTADLITDIFDALLNTYPEVKEVLFELDQNEIVIEFNQADSAQLPLTLEGFMKQFDRLRQKAFLDTDLIVAPGEFNRI